MDEREKKKLLEFQKKLKEKQSAETISFICSSVRGLFNSQCTKGLSNFFELFSIEFK